jgi:hypothetical protein
MRSFLRLAFFGMTAASAVACSHTTHDAATALNDAHNGNAKGDAIVVQAASCWLGGIWSDALGEQKLAWKDTRTAGIAQRCKDVLDDPGMRQISPRAVDLIARKLDHQAERVLLHTVASAARENMHARRAANRVKTDYADDTTTQSERRNDKIFAAPQLRKSDALVALLEDAGPYAADARAIGLLLAVDRVEIARGLPKHLKIEVLDVPCREVFGVSAPQLTHDDAAPIPSGTWLSYLSVAANAAGHGVPDVKLDPSHREPLAWNGLLDGFADKLHVLGPHVSHPQLNQVLGAVADRLDDQYKSERSVAMSYVKPRGS